MGHANETPEGTWWIARPENANRVFYGLCIVCGILLAGDLIFLLYSRNAGELGHLKGHFDFEDIPFFHGIYGFMAFVFVVLSGTNLRTILMRPEGFYDVPYTPREDEHHEGHGHDEHGHDENRHDEDHASHEHNEGEAHEEDSQESGAGDEDGVDEDAENVPNDDSEEGGVES